MSTCPYFEAVGGLEVVGYYERTLDLVACIHAVRCYVVLVFICLSVVSEREVLVVVSAADSFSNVESNLSVLFCWLEAFTMNILLI